MHLSGNTFHISTKRTFPRSTPPTVSRQSPTAPLALHTPLLVFFPGPRSSMTRFNNSLSPYFPFFAFYSSPPPAPPPSCTTSFILLTPLSALHLPGFPAFSTLITKFLFIFFSCLGPWGPCFPLTPRSLFVSSPSTPKSRVALFPKVDVDESFFLSLSTASPPSEPIVPALSVICHRFGSAGTTQNSTTLKTFHPRRADVPPIGQPHSLSRRCDDVSKTRIAFVPFSFPRNPPDL